SIEVGHRFSATAKLKWAAVDLRRKHAYIAGSTSKSKKPIAVPLNTEAMRVIKGQVGAHPEYVFTDHLGRAPIGSIKTAWRKACVRAKLPDLKWHEATRHTWASWHTMNGTPPIVLKELGGWASLAMVERYSHLNAGHLTQWAESGTKTGTVKRKKARKSAKR
ncbi:MAG TPA: site-specific integrase, partial [Steroidobacteraceae bacterium]